MLRLKLCVVVFGMFLALCAPLNAAPFLQVDIGGNFATGGFQVVQPGWDAFGLHELVPGGSAATHSYGPITQSITATIYGETVGYTFGQGPYSGTTIPSVYDDAALANVYGTTVGGGMKIEITGLTAGQQYSVEMWHWMGMKGASGVNVDWYDESNGSALIGTFTTSSALPTSDTDYKDTFLATANSSGTLRFSAATGPNTGYFAVNGLRLSEAAPVPEPATMLLLASGLVGLAGLRRKFGK